MRRFADIVKEILGLMPDPFPPAIADNLAVLTAELRILARASAYTPTESPGAAKEWARLQEILYRYMPEPAAYEFAQKISDLVIGVQA
jgi:hypothetical protein